MSENVRHYIFMCIATCPPPLFFLVLNGASGLEVPLEVSLEIRQNKKRKKNLRFARGNYRAVVQGEHFCDFINSHSSLRDCGIIELVVALHKSYEILLRNRQTCVSLTLMS